MKYYLEKSNLHSITSFPNCQKPSKAVIRHFPPDTPAEDVSNSLEDLGFDVISVRQMTATRSASNEQTHEKTLALFLVTLTRNIKSQEILKLSSSNHIIIKVELYRAHIALQSAQTAKILAMSEPTSSNPHNVCGAVVATCIGNALKR
jgi:hypothetical protein